MTGTIRARWRVRCGVSLVELLVVMAIMAVVAGMVVATASKVLAVINQWR